MKEEYFDYFTDFMVNGYRCLLTNDELPKSHILVEMEKRLIAAMLLGNNIIAAKATAEYITGISTLGFNGDMVDVFSNDRIDYIKQGLDSDYRKIFTAVNEITTDAITLSFCNNTLR